MNTEHEHYPEYASHWETLGEREPASDVTMIEVPVAILRTMAYATLACLVDAWEPGDNPDRARVLLSAVEQLARNWPAEPREVLAEDLKETAQTLGVWW